MAESAVFNEASAAGAPGGPVAARSSGYWGGVVQRLRRDPVTGEYRPF